MTLQCQNFEGLVETGTIVFSTSTTSQVVGLIYSSDLFTHYGETCDQCTLDRYLQCSNASRCDCSAHFFWNGSICRNQLFHQQSCSGINWCRLDLSLECVYGACQCALGSSWNGTYCAGKAYEGTLFNLRVRDERVRHITVLRISGDDWLNRDRCFSSFVNTLIFFYFERHHFTNTTLY